MAPIHHEATNDPGPWTGATVSKIRLARDIDGRGYADTRPRKSLANPLHLEER